MPGNAADRATAQRARTAQKDVLVFSLDSPFTGLLLSLDKWPRRRVVKDISVIHPERVLDVDRAFAFNAATAIPRHGETAFDRFFHPPVDAPAAVFLGTLRYP